MSTPNQPNDKDVERGAVAPPWKRGEQTAATGLTAGEMAKAAGVVGDDRVGGQPPRGPVSGGPASTPTANPSGPAQQGNSGSAQSASSRPQGPSGPASGPSPRPSASGPQSSGPQSSGPQSSGPQSSAKPTSGPQPQTPQPQTPQPQQASQPAKPAAAPQTPPAPAKPIPAPAPSKPFVESETRNIPRERLASKDELPDLDSIHHSEQAKEQALARAASQTIPARASSSTPLRAAVQIRRVDPWSIFKVSGVLCIAGFFIWMIAVAILYGVLGGMGIWDQINSSADTIVNGDGSSSGQDLISGGQVFMFSALFGIVGAVLLTGLATISAYIYNVCADFVGGVEVTLADLD